MAAMSAAQITNVASMSEIAKLISIDSVRCHVQAPSRKRVLQMISELVSEPSNNADTLFDGLMARERLGSTGLGDGVAIPHCRSKSSLMRAAFISLEKPIDYESSDGEPVDLLFVLVVPESEQKAHLTALAELAEVFSNSRNRSTLRACRSNDALLEAMQSALNTVTSGTHRA